MLEAPWLRLTRLRLWVIVGVSAVLVSAGGAAWIRHQARSTRAAKLAELAGIGRLKAEAITAWRAERLADAAVFSANPALARSVSEWFRASDSESERAIRAQLDALRKHHQYSDVVLADPTGRVRLTASDASSYHREDEEAVAAALRERTPVFTGLHVRDGESSPHLGVAAPLLLGDMEPPAAVGAVVLVSEAREFLYPLVESWPVPTATAETLLVERRGDEVVFLNNLRFRANAALSLREPLSRLEIAAVQAALGRTGPFDGLDYRGTPVLADLRLVPGSSWFIVSKVDRAEILGPLGTTTLIVLAAVVGLVLLAGMGTGFVYKAQGKSAYRELFRAESDRRQALEELKTTLHSIGDAVIATDADGRVRLLNPVAEDLTGWSETDASGRPLSEVFCIVNEATRQPAEDPAARVLREGTVVGLANHTVLIARDGTERPIADSGAPIRDEHGAVIGVVLVFRDQTAERAARRERLLLTDTIRASLDEIYIFEADTLKFRFVNQGALSNLGYTLDEATRLSPLDLKPELTAESFAALLAPLRSGEKAVQVIETVHRRKDGSRYPVEAHVQLFDRFGERVFLAVVQDVTERRHAEESLRRLNRSLRTLSECNEALVRATDEAQLLDDICRLLADFGGYRMAWVGLAEDDAERTVRPVAHAGVEDGYLATAAISWADTERGRGPTGMAIRERRPVVAYDMATDPAYVPWRTAARERGYASSIALPLLAEDGRCLGALNLYAGTTDAFDPQEVTLLSDLATDVAYGVRVLRARAAHDRAERALRESDEKFSLAFHDSPIAMALSTMADGAYLDANDVFLRDVGYTRDEVIGSTSLELGLFADPEDRARLLAGVRERGKVYGMPCRFRMKDGSMRDTLLSTCVISVGGTGYLLSAILDVTAQKRTEEALRASQSELRAISDGTPVMICILDEDRHILTGNRAFADATGWPATELRSDRACGAFGCINALDDPLGCGFGPLCTSCPLRLAIQDTLEAGTAHRDIECQTTLLRKGGQTDVALLAYTSPLGTDRGRRVVLCLVDITDRKRLEAQLLQAQKMQAIGTLAGGIAHDFNNLLQALLSVTQAAQLQTAEPAVEKSLGTALALVQRGASLTRQLLLFSRQQPPRREPVDARTLVGDQAAMLRHLLPETIALVTAVADEPLPLSADEAQLGQVLTNLAINARDAMPGGGRLTLSAAHRDGEVVIGVADTGVGIADDLRKRVFDPFFTTKPQGQGTGLGLSVVWGIVDEHGGRIEVESEPGRGSTFRIVLPAAERPRRSSRAPGAEAELPAGHGERIVLIEDEEGARDALAQLLTALGYAVTAAADGEEACRLPDEPPPHLVLTDFRLPGATGLDVARELSSRWPGLKVVVMSGYAPDDVARGLFASGTVHFLQKPFEMSTLAEALRAALGAPSEPQT